MARNSSINRTKITANVLVQIATLLAIAVMVNYFAFNHYKRWDFSRDKKYALSDQTKRVLETLKKPAKLIVFFSSASDIFSDVQTVAHEYAHASKMVQVEVIDPFMNMSRAREISARYKLGGHENVVVIDYDNQTRILDAAKMAEYEDALNPSEKPLLKAFKGEEILTGALLEMSEQGSNKVYALSGHGEMSLDARNLSGVKAFLERQNITLGSLDLGDVDAVPADAKALLLFGANYDFSDRDLQILRAYWNNKGRIYLLMDPHFHLPKFDAFLDELGVTANDDMVLKTAALPAQQLTVVLKDITGTFVEGSPITKRLPHVDAELKGGTRSLTLDEERVKPNNIKLRTLITASKGFWATTRYDTHGGQYVIYFNSKLDRVLPPVAVSVEKGGLSDERVQVDSSRMIAVGNSSFIFNEAMTTEDLDFFLSGVNWLLDREHMIGITPKAVRNFTLSLSQEQISDLALLTLLVIPGSAALLGLFSWLKRRR